MVLGYDDSHKEVIGLIPAGGKATRIAPLPCSKELYPIGFRSVDGEENKRTKVVSHYLLEKLRSAGITKAFFVLRDGKWDISSYYGDGKILDMHIAYLMMGLPFGVPYTLDQAYPFVKDSLVAFGFPDIVFQSDNAFAQLLAHQAASHADLVLGLFPTYQPEKMDMINVDDDGRVRELLINPCRTGLRVTWDIAVWTPVFTQFLHDHLVILKAVAPAQPELTFGRVIQTAIANGLRVDGVPVSDQPYLDIGTPKDLVKAVQLFSGQ